MKSMMLPVNTSDLNPIENRALNKKKNGQEMTPYTKVYLLTSTRESLNQSDECIFEELVD